MEYIKFINKIISFNKKEMKKKLAKKKRMQHYVALELIQELKRSI